MSDIMKLLISPEFYLIVIQLSTPIIFAALAAYVCQKINIVNISIEGTMLISALVAAIFSTLFHSGFISILSALICGVMIGFFFALFTVKLKANPILVGIAINMLAAGLVVFIIYSISGTKSDYSSVPLKALNIPLLNQIPFIGEVLFSKLNVLIYLAFIFIYGIYFFFNKTVLGLRIRAVGSNDLASASLGIKTDRIKFVALIIAGALSALGGAYMALGFMSSFNPGMISGRGFIGLAAESIGGGSVGLTGLFSVIFGLVNAFSLSSQTISAIRIPYEILNTFPYIVTLLGLIIFGIIKTKKNKKHRKDDLK